MEHRREYVRSRKLAGGGHQATAKCSCGWAATWCRTQREAADAYRAHAKHAKAGERA